MASTLCGKLINSHYVIEFFSSENMPEMYVVDSKQNPHVCIYILWSFWHVGLPRGQGASNTPRHERQVLWWFAVPAFFKPPLHKPIRRAAQILTGCH